MANPNNYPGIQYLKAVDSDGRLINFVAEVNWAGDCEAPLTLPLQTRLLWETAKFADLHNRFPGVSDELVLKRSAKRGGVESGEGLVFDAVVECIKVRCRRCHTCANVRKNAFQRAAEGMMAAADVTVFYTLSFGDSYFNTYFSNAASDLAQQYARNLKGTRGAAEFIEKKTAELQRELENCLGYDRLNSDHDAVARVMLTDDRQKLVKRIRDHLPRRFPGTQFLGNISIFEYGDLRGRLHLHGLSHFMVPDGVTRAEFFAWIKEFILDDWVSRGVGVRDAQDVQLYEPGTSMKAASYLFNYLLKYDATAEAKRVSASRVRLCVSRAYRKFGTIAFYTAFPKLVPNGMLREVSPREVDSIAMAAAAKREDWQYGEDLIMAAASQPAWNRLTDDQRQMALSLAHAAYLSNLGELRPPGWGDLEETDRDFPGDDFEFAHWVMDQLRRLKPEKNYGPALIDSSGADVGRYHRPLTGEERENLSKRSRWKNDDHWHPETGEIFTRKQWLSFTNAERAILASGRVPPWWS